jgi:phosphatidate cytidylyltransferase
MKTRLVTGVILITLALFSLFYSGTSRTVLALIISLGVTVELIRMAKLDTKDIVITLFTTGIIADITLFRTPEPFWATTFGVLLSGTFLSLLITELVRKKPYLSRVPVIFGIRSGIVGIILFAHLSLLFSSPVLSILVLSCIWATDSGAYFIGKLLGKHKLSSLSPNKTIEGSIGGLVVGSLLFALGAAYFSLINQPLVLLLPLGLLLSFLSQIGDLHESMIKRFFNVKDSSNILPGHGGIYDRCDSYIFTVPFFVVANLFVL